MPLWLSGHPRRLFGRGKRPNDLGVVAYPMRYQPLEPCVKDSHVSPNWSKEQLEMVAKARRVIGYGGAFPPHEGLKKKVLNARSFEEAFSLRPPRLCQASNQQTIARYTK